MIISHRHRFIFIHIHKTAGDAVCEAFRPHLIRSDFMLQSDFQAWTQRTFHHPPKAYLQLRKHSPALTVRQTVGEQVWNEYFKFAFVRHPLDRASSLYHFAAKKVEERRRLLLRNAWYLTPPGRRTDPLNWRTVQTYLTTNSFSEFIRHPDIRNDPALQPQVVSLHDERGSMIVDFVGRFERLDEDFSHVVRTIGLPATALKRRNASSNSRSSYQFLAEDKAYLAEMFEDDFDCFGYGL